MSNWVHQVLEFDGSIADFASAVLAKADQIPPANGYVASITETAGHVTAAIEDQYRPQLRLAAAVSEYLRATPIALAWLEPMNVWQGCAIFESGHPVALDRLDGEQRVIWSRETGLMCCYALTYLGDPRLGVVTQTLSWEKELPALDLRFCDRRLGSRGPVDATGCDSRIERQGS